MYNISCFPPIKRLHVFTDAKLILSGMNFHQSSMNYLLKTDEQKIWSL